MGFLMRTRSLALISIILFLASCAGGPSIRDEAPEWVSSPPQDSQEQYAFRGMGDGDTMTLARSEATDDLISVVLDAMRLGNPDNWPDEGRSAVNRFSQDLSQAVRNPDTAAMEGMVVARRDGWSNDVGSVTYAVDILWDRVVFDALAIELADATGIAGPEFRAFEDRARTALEAGNVYEAALLWAAAAGIAEEEDNISAYRLALRGIESALAGLEYQLESVPLNAYVGSRPSEPLIFTVSAMGKAVGDAEFLFTYLRAARDGSLTRGTARINSDENGAVVFLPPEVAFAGIQEVTIAPSSTPFLEYLDDPSDGTTDGFISNLEEPASRAEYEALVRLRSISMGILILETDLAGNPLDSDAAARGLLDDLLADGFDVEVMDLDPREMIPRSERALLRDIKADERFSADYERVLHARVSLESFEQDGDNYTVRVTGSLAMSDIDRQVTLFRTDVSKSSRAASSQQAMSAAFRQLGRSFAEELISQAP